MGKQYDFKKAKRLIEAEVKKEGDNLQEASLGIGEDWSWTAEAVYARNKFSDKIEGPFIAGIEGSSWGTPMLEFSYKDGKIKLVECFKMTELK